MNLQDKIRKYINVRRFVIIYAISVLLFIVFITNELTNTFDGMWHGSFNYAGTWEIRCGRFVWPFVTIARLGFCPEPFTTLCALAIFLISAELILYTLEVKDGFKAYLIEIYIICNTTILNMLSYRFMSITFAFAFLCSVISVITIKKKGLNSIIATGFFMVLTLGLYQAQIGCTLLIIAAIIIKMLSGKCKCKEIIQLILKTIVTFILSGFVYKLLWFLAMNILKLESTSYNGASDVSLIGIIKRLPERILYTYKVTNIYFFDNAYKFNIFQRFHGVVGAIIIVICIYAFYNIISDILRSNSENSIKIVLTRSFLSVVLLALMPILTNIACILAPESGTMIQQLLGVSLIPAILMTFISNDDAHNKCLFCDKFDKIVIFIFAFVLYGNIVMISVDQHTMLQGRRTTINLFNRIEFALENDGYDLNKKVIIAGIPSDNPTFAKDKVWNYSNDYARYGQLWTGGDSAYHSFTGVFRDTGTNLTYETDDNYYNKLLESDDVKNMPVYPAKDSIREIDGHIVVKVSNQ